jgi:hypothetical protein
MRLSHTKMMKGKENYVVLFQLSHRFHKYFGHVKREDETKAKSLKSNPSINNT